MMDNEEERVEETQKKESQSSQMSAPYSATDSQDEEELIKRVISKDVQDVVPPEGSETSAKPEKTGKAKRREKRLKNEPQSIVSDEGPSGVHVLDFAEARATELNHMLKAMRSKGGSKRAFQGLPRSMRRRAMSHNVKRLPRRLRKKAEIEMEKSSAGAKDTEPKKCGSRKRRRKPSNLKKEYQRRQKKYAWLETHIWHAKRMKMVNNSYGFRLAEHCSDKGVRAAYRSLIHGCMLSDISYYCCTEVAGVQSKIIACLGSLFNSDTGLTIGAKAYLSGQREGRAIMYKHSTYPYGAIGPVQFLWQASPPEKQVVTIEDALIAAAKPPSPNSTKSTKLWIWSHPAIHEQVLSEIRNRVKVYSAQQSQIAKQCKQPNDVTSVSVKSLKLDLVRFRLMGPRSHAVLMETLKPVFEFNPPEEGEEERAADFCVVPSFSIPTPPNSQWWRDIADFSSAHSEVLSSCYPSIKSASSPSQISRGAVLGMTVYDPRLYTPSKRTDKVSAYYPQKLNGVAFLRNLLSREDGPEDGNASNQREEEEGEDNLSSGEDMEEGEQTEEEEVGEDVPLEAAESSCVSQEAPILPEFPPVLAYSPIWDHDIRKTVSESKIAEQHLQSFRSNRFVRTPTLELLGKANRIPVLLIQQPMQSSGHGAGWDLILPSNWAVEFWVSLIYRGARACGMKELRKCSLETQAPHFPHDYPDTDGYKQHCLEMKEALESRYHSLPPDKRRNYGKLLISSPFLSPWSELLAQWNSSLPPKVQHILAPLHNQSSTEDEDGELVRPAKKPKLEVDQSSQVNQGPQVPALNPHTHGVMRQAEATSPGFYVLRCRDTLRALSQFISYLFAHKKQQKMISTVNADVPPPAVDYSDKFFQSCVKEFQIDLFIKDHSSSLVAVKFETNQRGTVGDRATISIPTDSDLRTLVTTVRRRPFSGPKEEINPKGLAVIDHGCLFIGVSSLTRKEIEEVKQTRKQREKAKKGQVETPAPSVSPAEEYKLCPVMPSRQEFGYVTTAGLRLTTSHSSGIGFCTFAGLLETVRRCYATRDVYELLALARGEDIQYWIIKLHLLY